MMKQKQDWVLLTAVVVMSLSANLPESVVTRFGVDRKILIASLVVVLAIALVRYVRLALVLVVVVLVLGANLPDTLAAELGISPMVMMSALGVVVVTAILTQLLRLLPKGVGEDAPVLISKRGMKSLLTAAAHGDLEQTEKLLGLGADINATDENGDTALIHAARQGYSDMIFMLLQYGADAHIANAAGETALTVARMNGFDRAALILQRTQKLPRPKGQGSAA